ncbi:hypothetical protein SLE2022_243610 [Rubroshorea leprosula]
MGNFSQVFKVLKRIDGCMYAVKHTTRQLHQDRKEESVNGSSSLGSSRVSGKHQGKLLKVVFQIAKLLQFMHVRGMAYLDVKPENVMSRIVFIS